MWILSTLKIMRVNYKQANPEEIFSEKLFKFLISLAFIVSFMGIETHKYFGK